MSEREREKKIMGMTYYYKGHVFSDN